MDRRVLSKVFSWDRKGVPASTEEQGAQLQSDTFTGRWYLRDATSAGANNIPGFTYGGPGDIPVVGDWDGDGIDTVGVVRRGVWYLRNSNTAGPHTIASFSYGSYSSDIFLVGDWNGDLKDSVGVAR